MRPHLPGADGDALPRWRPPGQCAVCRSWDGAALCRWCEQRFAAPVARCSRCGLRTATPTEMCGACLQDPPPFDGCVVALDYAFPWDRLIADFKFDGQVELAAPLAARLLDAILMARQPLPDWVLPVPLGPRRLAERGYNQAWELARRVARGLGRRADARLLERPLDGPQQAGLDLARRRRNLRGAYVLDLSRRLSLQGRHVALVDDVMTSGATLREAAAALRRGGVARVDAWALARTPAPGE